MIRRTIRLFVYVIVSSFIIFCLVEHTAGNPALLYLQRHGYTHITQANIEAAEHHLGLSGNLLFRYFDWLGHALTGNLGYSFITNESVMGLMIQAIVPTLKLIIISACILLPLGYAIGYFVGVQAHTRIASFIRGFAQVITSMPEYWLAILFVYYFGVKWHLVPFVGSQTWQHFILPIAVIVLIEGCHILLMTAHLIESTTTLEAYRLAQLRHYRLQDRLYVQIKAVFAPLLTISVNSIIHLFGKAVILEVIFSMSGLGKLLINAINQRDYPLIQGIIIIVIFSIMLVNYVGDMMILKSEPRVRMKRGKKLGKEEANE
ncbi:ABC transporter permease subunit [Staphylococcus coagulans]|uniref:ABC transporter permease subunit n=1 Tax=Staphylococcus coagulans TaxID=74706 RepID=UPI0015F90562|nr:ABC transporter permease subunit [Staphylococcus coagulans]